MEREVLDLYKKGDSVRTISKKLGCTKYRVKKILKDNNIKLRGLSESRQLYKYNQSYFRTINTERKAYFLGLMYADGNVCIKGRMRFQITLGNEDKYLLEEFLIDLKGGSRLYSDRGRFSKIHICSKKLCKDLIRLGCTSEKTFKIRLPDFSTVPEHLMNHFIRGYFDGDGSVCIRGKSGYVVAFTGNFRFMQSIKKYLRAYQINFSRFYKRYKNKKTSSGMIQYYENKNNRLFFDYLYQDATIFMKRKYLKMKNIRV